MKKNEKKFAHSMYIQLFKYIEFEKNYGERQKKWNLREEYPCFDTKEMAQVGCQNAPNIRQNSV